MNDETKAEDTNLPPAPGTPTEPEVPVPAVATDSETPIDPDTPDASGPAVDPEADPANLDAGAEPEPTVTHPITGGEPPQSVEPEKPAEESEDPEDEVEAPEKESPVGKQASLHECNMQSRKNDAAEQEAEE